MAAQIGGDASRKRAFVLVDKDQARGVFSSWDAAEAHADEHGLSLDRLLEFETDSDHPNHLHLMAAQWDGEWKFVGEWSKFAPYWAVPPSRIRLDHYHARGNVFVLFRQHEFPWRPGILQKINPMAPDQSMRFAEVALPDKPTPPPAEWKPKLSPLKPLGNTPTPTPASTSDTTASPGPQPAPSIPAAPAVSAKKPPAPLIPEPEPPIEELPVREPPAEPGSPIKQAGQPPAPGTPKPRITFQKKQPLRLKSQQPGPKPIPDFKPAPLPPATSPEPTHSSVELAQEEMAAQQESASDSATGKPRRIWPLRVLVPIFAVFLCWGGGIFWVVKPEPTAQNILSQVTTLSRARVLVIEPDQIFFQLEVDPINQQRWVQSLQLMPISETDPILVPTYHTLDTWQRGNGFVRPPYADIEVREWWDLRLRIVQHGFFHEWEDGSMLILDLESDLLIGWSRALRLPELLN